VSAAVESVLLVDDEPQVLVALEDLLSDKFVVLKTTSPEGALELVRKRKEISVVISDQRMPSMSGDELFSRLGESSDAKRILVTGFADLTGVIRAVNEGKLFAYVTKPWDPEDLRVKVDRAAQHFRMARELTHERELLRDLMDNSPDGIYFKNRNLQFLSANRSFAQTLGLSDPEEIVGRRLDELLARDDVALAIAKDEETQVIKRGETIVDHVRARGPEGARRWISDTKAPIRSPDGTVVGLVGISRDVTTRIEAEGALRQQTTILNSILDSMAEGVVVVDPDGQFVLVNPEAQRLLGCTASELRAEDWLSKCGISLSSGQDAAGAPADPLRRAMAEGAEIEREISIENPRSSRPVTAMLRAVPLTSATWPRPGGLLVLRNVTDQRVLERKLREVQKMEALGQLAGGVAHDFNNLLCVMSACGQTLLEQIREGDPMRQDVEPILEAAERGAGLTRQLLAFGRRQLTQPKNIELNRVVSSLRGVLLRLIREDIELRLALSENLGLVHADQVQIEQILMNLVVNARDAMPQGGRVTITTENAVLGGDSIPPSGAAEGRYVLLAVGDTGVGMSREVQSRMFEPFFTTKEIGKGTGLGLASVYGIVQQSGGTIRVESELDKGTTFRIYLPRVEAVPSSVAVASPPSSGRSRPPRGTTVLVVEDDVPLRRVTGRILRHQGYNVLEAGDVEHAKKIFSDSADSIDLLLTDVVMPKMSGPELARELSAQRPSLRVLFVSGYAGTSMTAEEAALVAKTHLDKPFTAGALLEKIRTVLEEN
jgi:two-component system cell cycle sensor histidine kinase/response regulator CckA